MPTKKQTTSKPQTRNAPEPQPVPRNTYQPPFPMPRQMAQQLPAWATSMMELEYSLLVSGPGGGAEEEIYMEHDEYVALKFHLAYLRGLGGARVEDLIDEIAGKELTPDVKFGADPNELARHIYAARTIYRIAPNAVVRSDEALDSELRQLGEY